MSDHSAIEWTDATWNPVRGCTKISPGCKFCYAETFAERFRGVSAHPFTQGSFVIFVITTLAIGLPQLRAGGGVMKGAKTSKTAPAKPAAPAAPAPVAPAQPAPTPGSPR